MVSAPTVLPTPQEGDVWEAIDVLELTHPDGPAMESETAVKSTALAPQTARSTGATDVAVRLPAPSDFPAYARVVALLPVPTPEQEQRWLEDWRTRRDPEAARALVLGNLHLVVKIVRNHQNYGLPLGDLAQEGTIGLMKAVHKFDPSRSVRLSTYAWHWIEAEVREFVLRQWRLVSWGTSTLAKRMFFGYRKTVAALRALGEERSVPTAAAIAAALDISEADARLAQSYFLGADVALFDETTDEDGDGAPRAPRAVLIDEGATPLEAAQAAQEHDQRVRLRAALPHLSQRHQDVLRGRYLTETPRTLSDFAAQWGVSVERARQIEQAAIKALRAQVVPALTYAPQPA